MKINKYCAYFHDGGLIDIKCSDNSIEISMYSAEVDPEDIENSVVLAKNDCISGVLHFQDIKNVEVSGGFLLENLLKTFDDGSVLDFDIKDETVELGILWTNYLPKPYTNEFSWIVIKAGKIWWENVPELYNSFCLSTES